MPADAPVFIKAWESGFDFLLLIVAQQPLNNLIYVLMKKLFISIVLLFAMTVTESQESYLVVGTYTGGKSKGIYIYKFNSSTGTAVLADSAVIENPSFVAVSPDQRFVYAANETGSEQSDGGKVTAFAFDKKTGKLTQLNQQSSGGNHPCYVAVDKTGKWVAVGNYSSGTLALLPVRKDGSLAAAAKVIKHEGRSVNTQRQEGPHVHCTAFSPDNKFLFVSDLGIDKIMAYAFNSKTGELTPAQVPYTELEAGSGPRHLAFHPSGKYVYLAEEMSGGVEVFNYLKQGQLEFVQHMSALPPDYSGPADGADIHVSSDGKFLYSSTRGQSNNIAIFSINPATGMLVNQAHQSTLGKTPRNFNFDPTGNYLLAANQNSDEIVIFKRDKTTGLLEDSGQRIAVGKPVCVQWISAK